MGLFLILSLYLNNKQPLNTNTSAFFRIYSEIINRFKSWEHLVFQLIFNLHLVFHFSSVLLQLRVVTAGALIFFFNKFGFSPKSIFVNFLSQGRLLRCLASCGSSWSHQKCFIVKERLCKSASGVVINRLNSCLSCCQHPICWAKYHLDSTHVNKTLSSLL